MRITQFLSLVLLAALSLAAHANIHQEIHQLSREKFKLTRQVGKLFQEKKLGENPEYQAGQKAAFLASRAYVKAQKAHPKLKNLFVKIDAAQKKWIDARVAKDKEAAKTARKAFTQSRMDIEKAAREIPELVALQKKAIDANNASQQKQKEILATTPEGKALVDKINALDEKIKALRKKMAQPKP